MAQKDRMRPVFLSQNQQMVYELIACSRAPILMSSFFLVLLSSCGSRERDLAFLILGLLGAIFWCLCAGVT